ncbi:MAG: type II secretion system GspH family protein [Blastocatellia bacterium]|nr:type II secretion system GspH family protein [Blastocatellia bacterium]
MGKRTTGFSLLELLIVVGISGIIATIAIPNLLTAKRQANGASAIQTLRNLHAAEMTYSFGIGRGNFADNLAYLGGESDSTTSHCGNPAEIVAQAEKVRRERAILSYRLKIFGVRQKSETQSATYHAIFRPLVGSGILHTHNEMFYVDETGILRHSGSSTVWPDENSAPIP